ncbi:MAG TPA: DUF5937 family protein [Trebonia sp.]|jgi:DNA-binding transcriptional ArsR family regulator
MIELVFGPADLLQVRFAISPAEEVLGAIRTVAEPARHAYHLPWLRRLRDTSLDGLAELTTLITPLRGYAPDFLSPPPTSPLGDLDEQLSRLLVTPLEVIEAELTESLGEGLPDSLADPAAARDLLARQMATAWERLLAPSWSQMRDLLQADVLARGRQLAETGTRAVFDGLHPRVRWSDGSLRILGSRSSERLALSGDGLLLVPSVFAWPGVMVMMRPPWQAALIFPARGVAALWQPPSPEPTLIKAFGRTRGTLLLDLVEPATTAALARKHGMAPSTVSAHLTALRDAGLLTARRDGRSTYYELSPIGYALMHGR